ncbi:MAG: proprotein convertase P-domain-containing protein [Holophagales bacterium]|nr:proprotein convertase P-domain-containing protein [Holophagales bacterium]
MFRRLAAVAVACALASPAWGGVKEDKHQQMIGFALQMRDLRASGATDSARYASLASQYAQLSASLGGDDPGATLPDGQPAVDGRGPEAPEGTLGVIPPPPPGCIATTIQVSNNTPVPIPPTAPPIVVTSTINVAGVGTFLWDVNVRTDILHTFPGDLDVTIQSPAGTVVTLTTDNGVSNDNVFNGTIWDDGANPGGQVPYSTNNGLATDHVYVINTLASPLVPEEAFGAFIGEDPNGTWTLTISDDGNQDGGSLEGWTLELTMLPVAPALTTNGFGNPASVPIPPTAPPNVVTSTIVVAGLGTVLVDLDVTTNLLHSFPADLDVTVQSPAGTVVTLTTDNALGNVNVFNGTIWDDDANPSGQVPYSTNNGLATDHAYANLTLASPLVPEEALAAFIGEDPNGVWTITISDDFNLDGGSLDGWSLTVTTGTCGAPCELTCPNDVVTSNAPGQCGATVNFPAPTTNGDCGPIVCTPPSGGFFPVGTTPVLCVEDVGEGGGGGPVCGFDVTVNDTEPPTLTPPANQNVGTDTGVCTAVVNYPAPTVGDNCPGVGAPSCVPPSGSTFNLGVTPTSCTVSDAAGNSAGAGFTVTVFDDEPPAIACPADLLVAVPPGALSWPVSFTTPTPTDNCPGVGAACDPASGDAFPVGTTTDVCTATDAAGLTSACDFDVTLAEQSIQEIPTASTLGLAALALLLAGAAFVALRRHG